MKSAPASQATDEDSEDGPCRRKREAEGKRQNRDTEHLIHWRSPDRKYRLRTRKLEGCVPDYLLPNQDDRRLAATIKMARERSVARESRFTANLSLPGVP